MGKTYRRDSSFKKARRDKNFKKSRKFKELKSPYQGKPYHIQPPETTYDYDNDFDINP